MKIDAHQHFWEYNAAKHSWINDEMAVLKQDFLPKQLWAELGASKIDGCVAVQADQTEAETDFLLDLASRNDFIKGIVGWVDLRSTTLKERLEHYKSHTKLVGFRHVVQDEPDVNFMLGEAFKRGIGELGAFGYTYDILIFPTQMEAAEKIVAAYPNQKFVIDHIAKPYIAKGAMEPWKSNMKAIASHENVSCKVSGMITEADWKNWNYDQLLPYLDMVFESFGPERIMFGSDWPVCLLAGKYSAVKSIVAHYVEAMSDDEQEMIWGKTAQMFYGLT